MGTSRPNESIILGLECLTAVTSAQRPVGSREVARLLGVEHTKVNRALGTLEALGLTGKTSGKKYVPGPGIHVLAAQSLYGSGLLSAVLPELRKLHKEDFTVAAGVLWKDHVCYLVHARTGQSLDEGIGRHELWPVEKSSLGLVLRGFNCEKTKSKEVIQKGYARLDFPNGEVSLAVPVGEPVVAAIGVSKPDMKGGEINKTVRRLKEISHRISEKLNQK